MKSFDLRTSTYIVFFLAQLFLILLLFSFRDSLRSIIELFNLALIRKSIRPYLPRYSLRTLLIAAAILPPCLAYIAKPLLDIYLSGAWFFIFFLCYFLVMLGILIYYCATDIFGASPRKRWEKHLKPGNAIEEPIVKDL